MWVEFARAMAPLAGMSAILLANLLDIEQAPAWKVLDIAAGHGMFGITLARLNPGVQVTALDWKNVLAVAERTRGRRRGGTLPHASWAAPSTCHSATATTSCCCRTSSITSIRRRASGSSRRRAPRSRPGGRVVIVEFVPNDDRSGPADAVRFSLVMLAGTPAGDAYTFAEYQTMLRNAGFAGAELHDLLPSPGRVVIATADRAACPSFTRAEFASTTK